MNPPAEAPPNDATPPGPPPAISPSAGRRLSRRASIIGGLLALLLLGAVGGLAWYLTGPATTAGTRGGGPGGPGGGRGGAPAGSTVGVATAERTSIPVILDALGTVTPQATVRVRPQVSGVLEKVLFKEGQMVRAGELLATIDARQFEMALMQASGQRLRDEAQRDSAAVTLQRFKTLLEQDSIARQDVDTQAALVKQLEAAVVIDKASEGTARLNLGYTRVVAPVSGRLGLRAVDVGNVVSSSDASGVVLITQMSPIDVVFSVPQDRVGELPQAPGSSMKATALDRTRAKVLDTGVFASLDNLIDTATGTVKAKARFANTQLALFPNQFVNIQLLVRSLENVVVVPVTALRQGSSGDYVYVLNAADRTVSLRPVKRGQATVDKIVVESGLKAGEQVITEGADRLKDGSRVNLAGDAPRTAGPNSGRPGRRQDKDANPSQGAASSAKSPASAPAATSVTAPGAPVVAANPLPTPEQRARMLDKLKDDPVGLERRKKFLERLDAGEPEALARWKSMSERRQQDGRPAQ